AIDCHDTGDAHLSTCGTASPEGRLGARLRDRGFELYASAGRYARLPTLSELHGSSLLVRGNPMLRAESGNTIELGARFAYAPAGQPIVWLDTAAFGRWTTDLVTYVRTAQGFLHPLNRDQNRTLGGEISVGAAPLPDV